MIRTHYISYTELMAERMKIEEEINDNVPEEERTVPSVPEKPTRDELRQGWGRLIEKDPVKYKPMFAYWNKPSPA